MRPFRKNVALAVDGGGIRGVIVTRALSLLEEHLGRSVHDIFRLTAGTSTGSIISGGVAVGLTAREMYNLYCEVGEKVFRRSWRSALFPISRYRYPGRPLEEMLNLYLGTATMGDLWSASPATDLVIPTFDLVSNHTCFVKPWKPEYKTWPLVKAVQASCTVPTYFPIVEGRYVDGGVGAYSNPAYLAAYEALFCLNWDPAETTLISLGTGRSPHHFDAGQADRLFAWQWISPILGAFLQSADDQQVHLVETFFKQCDFRRFNVDLPVDVPMDSIRQLALMQSCGEELGHKILADQVDRSMGVLPQSAYPPARWR